LVTDLHVAAQRAWCYVSEVTGLTDAAADASLSPVKVVDRPGFIRANTQMVEHMGAVLFPDEVGWAGRQSAAAQIGAVLAVLSSRVLGQFDPFTSARGRLLLVAPNVLQAERLLEVPSADFRLWVALHEQTHAVQFAAAPWLPQWLSEQLTALTEASTDGADGIFGQFSDLLRQLPRVLRNDAAASPLTDYLPEPAQVVLAQVTATMSLLEGHADVVMDAVGPRIIGSVEEIRAKFNARRSTQGGLNGVIRRLTGLDAKIAQYSAGARFVHAVIEAVGHAGLARAFEGPANLPGAEELADPEAWVARVCG
jgi:coenzyme F420 biosynthesis associated uncharacterized protein